MPKLRSKKSTPKEEGKTKVLTRNCRVTVTRMSLKDIAAELSGKKCNVDCQLGEDEINRFLASQKAIAVNKVPIYKRNVVLAERSSPRNDVYQFKFDAATESKTKEAKKTRNNRRIAPVKGFRKRKARIVQTTETTVKQTTVIAKPNVAGQKHAGSVRRTRASSAQVCILENPDTQVQLPQTVTLCKSGTPTLNKNNTGNAKENITNSSCAFVELEITDSNITDKRLEQVKQFGQSTSTPMTQRKSVPNPSNTTYIPARSPWRIQDETRCPKTFYFSCSKDLTPSYASDVILHEVNLEKSLLGKSTVQPPPPTSVSIENRSFEANNSNAENICPYISPNRRVNVLSNVLLKPGINRSPLKQMEIIGLQEEIEKPVNTTRISTLATHSLTASNNNRIRKFATSITEKQPNQALALRQRSDIQPNNSSSIYDCAIQSSDESTARDKSDSIEGAFGFYTVEDIDLEYVSTDDEQHDYSKNALKQRLKSLKKLAPCPSSKTTRLPCQNQVTQLFRSPRRRAKPTNILEMFENQLQPDKCSTPQRPTAQCENASLTLDEIEITGDDAASIRLFNDPSTSAVPAVEHSHRRSYTRMTTRKRKKVIGFIAVSDDESHSDSETDAGPSRTKKIVRSKKKIDVEETSEFKAFVVAMNNEFAEVEKYELIIN